jgi:hypothetical protein
MTYEYNQDKQFPLVQPSLDYREADSTESYNETILRMLNRKKQIIIEQSERIKQLEYKIRQLIPTDVRLLLVLAIFMSQGKEWEV